MPGLRPLRPFPGTGPGPRPQVRAGAWRVGAVLSFRWKLVDATGSWCLPRQLAAPVRADRLWQHTCLEAFVAPDGSPAYWEVNLSPAGDWNVYRFAGHRCGMTAEACVDPPAIRVVTGGVGAVTLDATVDVSRVGELATAPLAVGLAAVLESRDGSRSYWALAHPGDRPDFHRRESFLIALAGPGGHTAPALP